MPLPVIRQGAYTESCFARIPASQSPHVQNKCAIIAVESTPLYAVQWLETEAVMFEPEVCKMVRTLERDRVDRAVYWRIRLAEEHRAARRSLRFWRGHTVEARHDD